MGGTKTLGSGGWSVWSPGCFITGIGPCYPL